MLENLSPAESEALARMLDGGGLWRISPQMAAIEFSKREGFPFSRERHQQLISDAIVEADLGTGRRFIVVSMPPQHGKSELISRRTPEWFLGKYPRRKVGIVGYGANFAQSWGEKIRDDMNRHQEALGFKLKDDSQSKSLWHTEFGGECWTAGIKSGATGRGADLLIIDDPIKNNTEASNPNYRHELWEELTKVFFSRISKRAIVVMVMTRWHPDDPIGRVLGESTDEAGELYEKNPNNWREIRLPAIWEKDTPVTYAFGDGTWTRRKGDPLCPARHDLEALNIMKGHYSEDAWASLYQQDPNQSSKRATVYYAYNREMHEQELVRDPSQTFFLSCDFNRTPMSWVLGQWSEQFGPQAYITNQLIIQVEVLDEISIDESNVPDALEAFYTRLTKMHSGPDTNSKAWELYRHDPVRYPRPGRSYELPLIHLYGDAAGKAESHAGPDLSSWAIIKRFMRDRNLKFVDHVPSKDPLIQDRVNAVNEALKDAYGTIHLAHDPKCAKLRQDFEKVTWKRDSTGQSIGKLDPGPHGSLTHMSDALGYFLHQKFAIRPKAGPQRGSPR